MSLFLEVGTGLGPCPGRVFLALKMPKELSMKSWTTLDQDV